VEYGLVDKRGAYFRYGETLIGQGRENAKTYLAENPEMLDELEYLIRREVGLPTEELEGAHEALVEETF